MGMILFKRSDICKKLYPLVMILTQKISLGHSFSFFFFFYLYLQKCNIF